MILTERAVGLDGQLIKNVATEVLTIFLVTGFFVSSVPIHVPHCESFSMGNVAPLHSRYVPLTGCTRVQL